MTTTIERSTKTSADKRSQTTTYNLPDSLVVNKRGEDTTAQFEVTTRHDKTNKRYVSSVNRQTRSGMWVRFVITYGQDNNPYQAFAERADRFNASKMDLQHNRAVHLAEAMTAELAAWAIAGMDVDD